MQKKSPEVRFGGGMGENRSGVLVGGGGRGMDVNQELKLLSK